MEVDEKRLELQDCMTFLGALSAGLEGFIGPAARGMAFLAGKNIGRHVTEDCPRTTDVIKAIEEAGEVLRSRGLRWSFEPWKPTSSSQYIQKGNEPGTIAIKLVFRDCMIRQSLFCYGHKQQQSLCYMMYGFFSGALETIMGLRSSLDVKLEILHSGPNACLKQLTIAERPGRP